MLVGGGKDEEIFNPRELFEDTNPNDEDNYYLAEFDLRQGVNHSASGKHHRHHDNNNNMSMLSGNPKGHEMVPNKLTKQQK